MFRVWAAEITLRIRERSGQRHNSSADAMIVPALFSDAAHEWLGTLSIIQKLSEAFV